MSVETTEMRSAGSVSITGALTRNLQDYNSLKVGVTVMLPCGDSDEEFEAARARCSGMVSRFIAKEFEAWGVPMGDA